MINKYWGATEGSQTISSQPVAVNEWNEARFVQTVNNRIYFYSETSRSEILQLNKRLRELSCDLRVAAEREERNAGKIYLHINSHGGAIFHGLAAMDEILRSNIPVVTIVDGCCASAGTFLSVVGNERYIQPHGFMLIHQLSSNMWGKYREFEDEKKNLDLLMHTIKNVYKQYTKIPSKK